MYHSIVVPEVEFLLLPKATLQFLRGTQCAHCLMKVGRDIALRYDTPIGLLENELLELRCTLERVEGHRISGALRDGASHHDQVQQLIQQTEDYLQAVTADYESKILELRQELGLFDLGPVPTPSEMLGPDFNRGMWLHDHVQRIEDRNFRYYS